MGHLRRIILIHTHIQGVVELLLDDHANICGNNAAGKTTLQRLLPVFYGELPNRVVPRTRKQFHQFYLPFSNSYLVYEYQREAGDTAMVVLTRDPQGGVQYRFIAAAYEPTLFLHVADDRPKGVAYKDLTAGLRQAGIDYSPKFDATSEYRSVILNDLTQLRGSNRDGKRLRQMALRYSLVQPGHRLRHMEKLVSAVHAKEGKMDTLKTMLAAIFEEDGVELPVTRLRTRDTRQWIGRMRQSLNLDQLAATFSHWQETGQALAASEAQLQAMQPVLAADAQQHRRGATDAAEKLLQIERSLQQTKDAWQRQRAQLHAQQLDHQQAYDNTQRTLDDIQQHYDRYLANDMDTLAQHMEQLPDWRRDREQQAEQVRVLKAEVGDVQQEFDRHKAQLLEQRDDRQQTTTKRLDTARTELDALKMRHAEQREQLTAQYQRRREHTRDAFAQQEASCQQQRGEVLTQLKGSLLTPDELDGQQHAQQRIEHAQQAVNEAGQVLARANQAWQDARQAHEQGLREAEQLRQQRSDREQACHRLQQQFDPRRGTLRHFLRAQLPGWEQQVGKVIREDLLSRQDLAPRLDADAPNLWGLQLDLAVVDAPDYALDEVALQQALAQAQADLETAQKHASQHAEQVKQLQEQVEVRQQAVQQGKRQQQTAQQEVDYAVQARDRLYQELKTKEGARRKALQEQQQTLEQQLATRADERGERLRGLQQEFDDQQLELRADNDEQEARQQQRIEQLQATMAQQRADTETHIDELRARFDTQLAERGIDHRAIARAEQVLTELNNKIQATQQRRDELDEYQRFMRVQWRREKPTLVAREAELRALLQQDADAFKQAEQQYQAEHDRQQRDQRQWRERQAQAEAWREALDTVLGQIAQLPQAWVRTASGATKAADHDADAGHEGQTDWGGQDERIERARHVLQAQAEQHRDLDQGLKRFNVDLTQGATDGFAQRLNYEIERLQAEATPHVLDYLAIYRDMLQILRDQQTELLQQGRNIGGDLNKFFTVFHDLNRRIHTQSRRLSAEVANDLTLEGISRAEVRIQSTIDQLDFWQPLTRFAERYEAWEASGAELPGEAYLNALAEVAELLRQDQQYTFESLLQLELRLTEGGNDLVIRSDRQLLESSSHGMAYLILCQFMLAFTRLLRGGAEVTVHWPIDEIGTLAYRNVEQLFAACQANRIYVLGAFPNAESDVLTLFKHRYLIERATATSEVRCLKRIEPKLSPLAARLNSLREAST